MTLQLDDVIQLIKTAKYTDYHGKSHDMIDLLDLDDCDSPEKIIYEVFRAGHCLGLARATKKMNELFYVNHPVTKLLKSDENQT